jgi:sulfate transport system ATP-binding protein
VAGAIEVRDLTKSFGSFRAVDNISFQAAGGAITALLGPSGSGKSTVLRIIAGLEQPDSGSIFVAGEELTNASVQDRRLGFVFQHYALFRHKSVRRNVAFGLAVRGVDKAGQRARVDELLELVGLAPFAERYPDQLSGGQRQRVALARALAPRPRVLLLDEPFGALDARVRQELRRWLEELHHELGVTSLFVTHDQEEALELASEIVVMNHGRIEQIGSADAIYNHPATPFVAGFVGATNALQGVVREGHIYFGSARGPATEHAEGAHVVAYVRPHDIEIAHQPGPATLAVTVDRRTDLGWTAKLQLRLADDQTILAQVRNDEAQDLPTGTHLYATLHRAKIFPNGGHAQAGPVPSAPVSPDTDEQVPSDQASAPSRPMPG